MTGSSAEVSPPAAWVQRMPSPLRSNCDPLEAIRSAEARGLAVPGMPMGSPGMEGGRKDAYDVIAFDRQGKRSVYAKR